MPSRRTTLLTALAVGVVGLAWWLGAADALGAVPAWARDAGGWGMVAFGAIYVVTTVLLLPASVLTLGAGLAWGPWVAFAIVWPAATLGALAAFGLSRTWMRRWAEAFVARDGRFAAVDQAIAEDGFRLVFLMRLSPVFPFSFLNVALGLTAVPWWQYALSTAVGIAPGTLLYAYLGSIGHQAGDDGAATLASRALFWAGLAATLAVTVLITRTARRALNAHLDVPTSLES